MNYRVMEEDCTTCLLRSSLTPLRSLEPNTKDPNHGEGRGPMSCVCLALSSFIAIKMGSDNRAVAIM